MDAHPVVLFDGVCNLCNAVVNFVIDHDPDAMFRFAALQSDAARDRLAALGEPPPPPDPQTFLLLDEGTVYRESTAALLLLGKLRGPLRLMKVFLFVPRPIRDGVYRFIARHRYGWFGRTEACRMPTAELKARFL
jgi:predicted DCC family thiol-disulfide oxidoreductase YuxK